MPTSTARRSQKFVVSFADELDFHSLCQLVSLSLDTQKAGSICQAAYYNSTDTCDISALFKTETNTGNIQLNENGYDQAAAIDIKVGNHNYEVTNPHSDDARLTLRAAFETPAQQAAFEQALHNNLFAELVSA